MKIFRGSAGRTSANGRINFSSTINARIGRFYFWVGRIEARTKTYVKYVAGALEILTPPEPVLRGDLQNGKTRQQKELSIFLPLDCRKIN